MNKVVVSNKKRRMDPKTMNRSLQRNKITNDVNIEN